MQWRHTQFTKAICRQLTAWLMFRVWLITYSRLMWQAYFCRWIVCKYSMLLLNSKMTVDHIFDCQYVKLMQTTSILKCFCFPRNFNAIWHFCQITPWNLYIFAQEIGWALPTRQDISWKTTAVLTRCSSPSFCVDLLAWQYTNHITAPVSLNAHRTHIKPSLHLLDKPMKQSQYVTALLFKHSLAFDWIQITDTCCNNIQIILLAEDFHI